MNSLVEPVTDQRVVYLFGAGASHGCVLRVGSPYGLLMKDLMDDIALKAHHIVQERYPDESSIQNLLNTVLLSDSDVEQVITFLKNSPSLLHQEFAEDLRSIFEQVLRDRLAAIRHDNGKDPVDLYSVLFDVHRLPGLKESLVGILTTNYDTYIEDALTRAGLGTPDLGFQMDAVPSVGPAICLLKLHGSFDWLATWPPGKTTIDPSSQSPTLWIPPGIQKAKDQYPFTILWGKARELLACDVLRIVGFRLDANDWDLLSLLFGTMYVGKDCAPYRIEVIDSPIRARQIQQDFPYLNALSVFELPDVGKQFVADALVGRPRLWTDLTESKQRALLESTDEKTNWFATWLRLKIEQLNEELGSVETEVGLAAEFLEAPA